MTFHIFDRTLGPAQKIWACRRGDRLIGHVVKQKNRYQARSWPSDILIGIYITRDKAVDAVGTAYESTEPYDRLNSTIVALPYQESPDVSEPHPQLMGIIAEYRAIEITALFRFLRDRGYELDAIMLLVQDALRRYEREDSV